MDFKTAFDRVTTCLQLDDVATAADAAAEDVRRALEKGASAPPEWERALARLARERARELLILADELDPTEPDPKWESAYG